MPQGATLLNIGDAARASGVSAKMIRHYESIGLLKEAKRTEAGYREQIGKLLSLWQDKGRASADVRALARTHIDELNRKIAEMEAMRRTLEALAASCHGDARSSCPILDDLAAQEEGG